MPPLSHMPSGTSESRCSRTDWRSRASSSSLADSRLCSRGSGQAAESNKLPKRTSPSRHSSQCPGGSFSMPSTSVHGDGM